MIPNLGILKNDKPLFIYLAVSLEAISSVLMKEEVGV